MASSESLHPTQRATESARLRNVRRVKSRQRTTWGLLLLVILLLIASVVVYTGRSNPPESGSQQATVDASHAADAPTILSSPQIPEAGGEVSTPNKARGEETTQTSAENPFNVQPQTTPAPIVIRIESPDEPAVDPKDNAAIPQAAPSEEAGPSRQIAPGVVTDPTPTTAGDEDAKPEVELVDAEFLAQPLPEVTTGAIAPARPITLLEFPSAPKEFRMEIVGLDELEKPSSAADIDSRSKLSAEYSPDEQSLVIRQAASNQELATFFLQKRQLRFRWKPRAALSALQQQVRSHCVLHATWKGHPGRHYALHESYIRSARRIRDQAVRLRRSELPTGVDGGRLFLGSGKLELAEVYSHRFLTSPLKRRAEVPTLKRSRKDPTLFVELEAETGNLAFTLDSPVNSEGDTKRRRKLFEHVDGNFYLHASLYRVVDGRVKVEVLRLGTP